MDIGLNIIDNVKINIGDSLEYIKNTLDKNGIEYKVHQVNSGTSGTDEKINIMYIKEQGVELNIINDSIVFIKSNNSRLNSIFTLDDKQNLLKTLKEIESKVADAFKINKNSIIINEFNGEDIQTILTIKNDVKSVKISLRHGVNNEIYINTIRLL